MEQSQAIGILIFGAILVALPFIVAKIMKMKRGGSGKNSDPCYVVRVDRTSGLYSVGREAVIIIGGLPFGELAKSIEVKYVIVDSLGQPVIMRGAGYVKHEGVIGTLEFSLAGTSSEFLCRAWIIKATFPSGKVWINPNADKEEAANTKWILKKLNLKMK